MELTTDTDIVFFFRNCTNTANSEAELHIQSRDVRDFLSQISYASMAYHIRDIADDLQAIAIRTWKDRQSFNKNPNAYHELRILLTPDGIS